jgi:hypothetical protein
MGLDRGGFLRSVHSLEFGKYESFGGSIDEVGVPTLGGEAFLLDVHRFLLRLVRRLVFQRPTAHALLLPQGKELLLQSELVHQVAISHRSVLCKRYLSWG